MRLRPLSAFGALALVACASVPATPSDEARVEPEVAPERDERAEGDEAGGHERDEGAEEAVAEPTVPQPIDHGDARCFEGAAEHLLFEGVDARTGLWSSLRTNGQRRRDAIVGAPDRTLRFAFALENRGDAPVVLDAASMARLSSVSVFFAQAVWWAAPLRPAGAEAEAVRLEPGATLRSCLELPLPSGRMVPFVPGVQPEREEHSLAFQWPSWESDAANSHRRTHVRLRFPREREAQWGPRSWGGVIAVQLAEDAVLYRIAVETGVRIGGGLPLHEPPNGVVLEAGATLLQAPPGEDAVRFAERLAARADVRSARALQVGDPGTEGCSAFRPCGRGESCCYPCGIEGCANECFQGRVCPEIP